MQRFLVNPWAETPRQRPASWGGTSMSRHVRAFGLVRFAMLIAIVATIALPGLTRLGSAAQTGFGPASHQDDARIVYLFGSGSTHGGRTISLRILLNEPAPSGGQVVTLNSESPDIIPLPDSVTVPAGATEFTFRNDTNPVISDIHVRVSASSGGTTKGR